VRGPHPAISILFDLLCIRSPEATLHESGLPEPNDSRYAHEDKIAEHDTGDAADNRYDCVREAVAGHDRNDERKAALSSGVGPTTVAEMESRETRDARIKNADQRRIDSKENTDAKSPAAPPIRRPSMR
jgi:hypothetical protein